MPRLLLLFPFLLLLACQSAIPSAEQSDTVTIVRDEWGVPHIFGNTDADVAYGLAWAQCEDDFVTLQEQMAACKGMLGQIKGKNGLIADFAIHFMGLPAIASSKYDQQVTGNFRKYLESYVAGVNTYATLHPDEVLLKDLFPLSGKDIIVGYLLGNMEVSGAGKDLEKIMSNRVLPEELKTDSPKGSNAIAIARHRTDDGKTYLAINSHQPLEGWYSWYEAHLISEEGMNILGGTFPGGICIFHGANEHLGWAHTVNHADFSDIYQLEMHPEQPLHYRFDGKWLPLKEKKYRAWMKLFGPLKIPVSRTIYESKYGPTFQTEQGFFAWRFVVGQNIKMAEQWYRMNKASSFDEFYEALQMRGLASLNIVYADQQDNIYYLSNGLLPRRDPDFNWMSVLPGDTSATLWQNQFIPLDSLPQVLNPACGWIFNTNNTPFSASCAGENAQETVLNKTMGYQPTGMENNRSRRLLELVASYDTISYADFKSIKYDMQYPQTLTTPVAINLELLLNLSANEYPDIAEAIHTLRRWNRRTDRNNQQAALFIGAYNHLRDTRKASNRNYRGSTITEAEAAAALLAAQKELLQLFGQLEIPLGEWQRHRRGSKDLPLGGGPDVLAAMYSQKDSDGKYRGHAGESYIQLVRFGPKGVAIESVHAYGSSARPDAAHYTSQMDLFVNQQLKTMTLDQQSVLQNAKKTYAPMILKQ